MANEFPEIVDSDYPTPLYLAFDHAREVLGGAE